MSKPTVSELVSVLAAARNSLRKSGEAKEATVFVRVLRDAEWGVSVDERPQGPRGNLAVGLVWPGDSDRALRATAQGLLRQIAEAEAWQGRLVAANRRS